MAGSERLLTTDQVADWLQLAPRTIRNWRGMKRGPRAVKIGGHVRYRSADVAEWIERQAEPLPARAGRPRKAG